MVLRSIRANIEINLLTRTFPFCLFLSHSLSFSLYRRVFFYQIDLIELNSWYRTSDCTYAALMRFVFAFQVIHTITNKMVGIENAHCESKQRKTQLRR